LGTRITTRVLAGFSRALDMDRQSIADRPALPGDTLARPCFHFKPAAKPPSQPPRRPRRPSWAPDALRLAGSRPRSDLTRPPCFSGVSDVFASNGRHLRWNTDFERRCARDALVLAPTDRGRYIGSSVTNLGRERVRLAAAKTESASFPIRPEVKSRLRCTSNQSGYWPGGSR